MIKRRHAEIVERDLDRLRSLDAAQLRSEWQLLYRAEPPKLSRDLLLLGLAYRVQERAHGSPWRAVDRKLRAMAASLRTTGRVQPTPRLRLKPGARLVREWHGRTHIVTVVAGGYEHDGRIHRSLSTIARDITGARWSGPRFFGLIGTRASPASVAARDG